MFCHGCWSEVPRGIDRCPTCGRPLTGGAQREAGWADQGYVLHLEDLAGVTDRRALVRALLDSRHFPDPRALGELLESVPCRLVAGLTLEESTRLKSSLIRLGARVRAERSSGVPVTSPGVPAPARRRGLPRARAERRARTTQVRRFLSAAAFTVTAAIAAAVTWLFLDLGRTTRRFVDAEEEHALAQSETPAPILRAAPDPAATPAPGHVAASREALARDDFEAAIGHLEASLAANPHDEDTHLRLAEARSLLGWRLLSTLEIPAAHEAFAAALQAHADHASALLGLAFTELRARHLDTARGLLERHRALDGDDARAALWMAEVLHAEGDLAGAIGAYERALVDDPTGRAHRGLERAQREREGRPVRRGALAVTLLGERDAARDRLLLGAAEAALQRAAAVGLPVPDEPLSLVFDPTEPVSGPDARACPWVGGEIRSDVVPEAGLDLDPSRLARVLEHRVAHGLVAHRSRGHAPGWLEEGLAMAVDGTLAGAAAAADGTTPATPDPGLDVAFTALAPHDLARARAIAAARTERLLAAASPAALRRLLDGLGRGLAWPEALVSAGLSDPMG